MAKYSTHQRIPESFSALDIVNMYVPAGLVNSRRKSSQATIIRYAMATTAIAAHRQWYWDLR
jgi:hypothetical protein